MNVDGVEETQDLLKGDDEFNDKFNDKFDDKDNDEDDDGGDFYYTKYLVCRVDDQRVKRLQDEGATTKTIDQLLIYSRKYHHCRVVIDDVCRLDDTIVQYVRRVHSPRCFDNLLIYTPLQP